MTGAISFRLLSSSLLNPEMALPLVIILFIIKVSPLFLLLFWQ
jgi:hypothetical protein